MEIPVRVCPKSDILAGIRLRVREALFCSGWLLKGGISWGWLRLSTFVVQDSGGNSSISRLTAEAWQRASSAWENTSTAMESAADAWDRAVEAGE